MNVVPFVERGEGSVTVDLGKKRNDPLPPIPYELQNVYTPEVWQSRVQAATKVCQDWSHPVLERLYFLAILIIQFVIPSVISNAVFSQLFAGDDGQIPPGKFFEFRAISMGLFVGTFILFWTPLIVWKFLGKRKVRGLQREWFTLDRVTSQNGFVSRWTITKPGLFSSTRVIRISVPSNTVLMTAFHPNAPLPPYINPAPGQPGGYGYPEDEKAGFQSRV